MNHHHDKLQRSIKVKDLPPGFDAAPIIEELGKAGEIDDYKLGPTEILITYKVLEAREAASLYDGIEIGTVKVTIDSEPTTLDVGQENENRTSYQKLDEIPMTTSTWDTNQVPGFLAYKEKLADKVHDEFQKKAEFELDRSNVIVSTVLGSTVLGGIITATSIHSDSDQVSYDLPNVIKEDPAEEFLESTKFEVKKPAIIEQAEQANRQSTKSVGGSSPKLVSRIQEINVPSRDELPKNDKFHNVTSKGFLLIFTATWAFAWFVSAF